MDIFEFIVGMISVILALAIAQLFIGVSDLIQRRYRVRFFLPHSVWGIVSDNRRAHVIIALAVLGSLIAVVSLRFLPGQG